MRILIAVLTLVAGLSAQAGHAAERFLVSATITRNGTVIATPELRVGEGKESRAEQQGADGYRLLLTAKEDQGTINIAARLFLERNGRLRQVMARVIPLPVGESATVTADDPLFGTVSLAVLLTSPDRVRELERLSDSIYEAPVPVPVILLPGIPGVLVGPPPRSPAPRLPCRPALLPRSGAGTCQGGVVVVPLLPYR